MGNGTPLWRSRKPDPAAEATECIWPECESRPHDPHNGAPVCSQHFLQIGTRFTEEFRERVSNEVLRPHGIPAEREERARELEKRRAAAYAAQSQVYYVRIGDYVKIGTTINLHARLNQLRLDHDALLATEPGGFALEKQRHQQFADERIGRRENFNPSRRLLAHIEQVRAEHGEPRITGYLKVA